jgi:two-component system, OmpR family, alkaline phosphatase synthesis response regulator PhoP
MPIQRVLVVDDEDTIQRVIQVCLEDLAGWEVLLAGCGSVALKLAETEQPDGILLDVSMPGMSGIEVLQHLRSRPATQAIPVAFLTARVQPDDREEFSRLGISGLIVKPFNPIELVEQIAEAFGWQL